MAASLEFPYMSQMCISLAFKLVIGLPIEVSEDTTG